ncbi:MAG: aminotransferase class I/II-fold pyridoxal phosphate-dependent enzyme, partial [Nitrospinota bacterium]|nr:aminotransferase class I/II-fold pyridoxal phosphate-dependent enzyme [Nitrospinota bacterium]
GYISIGPENRDTPAIFNAMTMANRILGFVNAPALLQRLVGPLQDVACDMSVYTENRKILVDGLLAAGYKVEPPAGGFYLFPQSPIADDVAFAAALKERNVLVVPGSGFGRSGHFRIAFCVEPEVCRRALPAFGQIMERLR